jgi:death-on-curing protein
MTAEPRWISREAILVLHDRSIALHGGAPGLRDEGLFEPPSPGLSTASTMRAKPTSMRWRLTASQADAARTVLAVAAGERDLEPLAAWLRRFSEPLA